MCGGGEGGDNTCTCMGTCGCHYNLRLESLGYLLGESCSLTRGPEQVVITHSHTQCHPYLDSDWYTVQSCASVLDQQGTHYICHSVHFTLVYALDRQSVTFQSLTRYVIQSVLFIPTHLIMHSIN